MKNEKITIKHFLDITTDLCPMTFVKATLFMERLSPGEIAEIRLNYGEPSDNVPGALRSHGHTVVSMAPEDPGAARGVQILRVRKG